ncbi:BOLA class I histocompatibility antigen, alpha chain BL3-6-like [Spea bombifrons]|uniref:BOLA class I histocompatibility antigen, alpha chain BL3-6-like n=1 Tax=Spea bombifrons TaxID=233779 RepID=UPI002349513C|nr:BOLA class I histocompatibility antigen, alpha chain BL3-6-like [Spea bombifrons]
MGTYTLTAVLFMVSCVYLVYSGSHSHYFFTTTINQPLPGEPSYVTTRVLDDIILYQYDNINKLMEVKVCWFKAYNGSLPALNNQMASHKNSTLSLLNNITSLLNETDGVHVMQNIEGCDLHDNGTVNAIFRIVYDGEPFITFNMETGNFTADVPEAQYFEDLANQNMTENEETIRLLTERSSSNNMITLECRAYGHYPKDILMVWERNGQQITEADAEILTLPLTDQTYLSVLSVNVTTTNEDTFTCQVTHNSTERPIRSQWRATNGFASQGQELSVGAVIAICLAVLLGVTIAVFGFLTWQRSRRQ